MRLSINIIFSKNYIYESCKQYTKSINFNANIAEKELLSPIQTHGLPYCFSKKKKIYSFSQSLSPMHDHSHHL